MTAMRKLIVLAFVVSAAACGGSKKAPQTPANTTTEPAPTEGSAAGSGSDTAAPAPGGDAMKSADPCEGGQ
jgi:ABC-type phosphate transport system substrate-binding protein